MHVKFLPWYSSNNDVNCCATVTYIYDTDTLPTIVSTGGSGILSACIGRRWTPTVLAKPWRGVLSGG